MDTFYHTPTLSAPPGHPKDLPMAPRWSVEEVEQLAGLYPIAEKGVVLQVLQGRSWEAICLKAMKLGVTRDLYREANKNDLKDLEVGRLIVLEKAMRTNRRRSYWLCRCECGNTKEIRESHLLDKKTNSCGCLLAETRRKRSYAFPSGVAALRWLCRGYRNRALKRNVSWELTPEQVETLLKGHCYYCNAAPAQQLGLRITATMNGYFLYNGIDRVDNAKGYMVSNCVSCCKHCNALKNAVSLDIARKMIEFIGRH